MSIMQQVMHNEAVAAAKKKQAATAAVQNKDGWMRTAGGQMVSPDQMVTDENGRLVMKGPDGLPSKSPGMQIVNNDGSAVRPEAIRAVDQNGNLKQGFGAEFQQLDPNSLDSYNMLKTLATGQGPTDAAQSQMALAERMKASNLDAATANSVGANKSAINNLAMRGGASSGSKAMIARQGAKDLLNARQGVNSQFTDNALKIGSEDATRKLDLLKSFGDVEGRVKGANVDIANKGVEFNKNLQGQGIANANQFMQDVYSTENDRWAAGKQAQATANSGSGGGGGGCCFIMLEARYKNGIMDRVVRKYRDEHMTEQNRRGYNKLASVLVPVMRKSKIATFMVRMLMTTPLVIYGRAYYGETSKVGLLLAPIKNFWMRAFNYLGQEHTFIQEKPDAVNEILELGKKLRLGKEELRELIANVEIAAKCHSQKVDVPIEHHFSKNVYAREMKMKKGTMVVGKIHKHENLNILSQGEVSVLSQTGVKRVKAPHTFVAEPGAQRVIYAHDDVTWTVVHGTSERNIEKIEREFIAKNYGEVVEQLEFNLKETLCLG